MCLVWGFSSAWCAVPQSVPLRTFNDRCAPPPPHAFVTSSDIRSVPFTCQLLKRTAGYSVIPSQKNAIFKAFLKGRGGCPSLSSSPSWHVPGSKKARPRECSLIALSSPAPLWVSQNTCFGFTCHVEAGFHFVKPSPLPEACGIEG